MLTKDQARVITNNRDGILILKREIEREIIECALTGSFEYKRTKPTENLLIGLVESLRKDGFIVFTNDLKEITISWK